MQYDRILVIQPLLTSYRKPMFDGFSKYFDKVEVFADLRPGDGFCLDVSGSFNRTHTPVIVKRDKVYYQKGVISAIWKKKPTVVFITADFRAVHYWVALVLTKALQIPCFSHGQGLYNKPSSGYIRGTLFKLIGYLGSKYICYTQSVRDSLLAIGMRSDSLAVVENTLVNNSVVLPEDREKTRRLFYLGRLREGCNLKLLFDAMEILSLEGYDIALDVIGDGVEKKRWESFVKDRGINVKFHGAIYNDNDIAAISKSCSLGVYPGDAGLSIVHYMSLSLVPIVHNDLTAHMGPEPSYIVPGVNGLSFERDNAESLAAAIKMVVDEQDVIGKLALNAFQTYQKLSRPTMTEKLISIMSPYLNTSD